MKVLIKLAPNEIKILFWLDSKWTNVSSEQSYILNLPRTISLKNILNFLTRSALAQTKTHNPFNPALFWFYGFIMKFIAGFEASQNQKALLKTTKYNSRTGAGGLNRSWPSRIGLGKLSSFYYFSPYYPWYQVHSILQCLPISPSLGYNISYLRQDLLLY